MAVVPTYQKAVEPISMPSVRQSASAPSAAFGGNVAQAAMGIQQQAYEEDMKQKALDDADAVVKATNTVTSSLLDKANGENGFLTRQGENAKGITDEYKKAFVDLTTEAEKSLANDTQKSAFRRHMTANAQDYLRSVYSHERNEIAKLREQNIMTGIKVNTDSAVANFRNTDSIDMSMNKIDDLANLQKASNGWSNETADLYKKSYNSAIVSGAVNAAMKENETDQANNLLEKYKDKIDASVYENLHKTVKDVKEKQKIFTFADDIVNQAKRPDGTIDVAAAENLIRQYTTKKGQPSQGMTFEEARDKISGQESGGNYDAVNPESGAKGKYQFMPETWKALMGDAPMTPENQEIAFEKKYKPIFEQYGARGMAAAVYAGDANAERFVNGQTLLGEDGEYSADAPQGNYPSVREYVDQSVGQEKPQGESQIDVNEYNQLRTMVSARIADQNRMIADQKREYKKSIAQQIDSTDSASEQIAIIDASDLTLQEKAALRSMVTRQSKLVATGSDYDKQMIKYGKSGFYKDTVLMQEYADNYSNGEDITEAKQKKYNDAKTRLDTFNAWQNPQSAQDVNKQIEDRYQEILSDIWNSKSKKERIAKINDAQKELNQIGRALDIDVNNDLQYIISSGQE